MSHSESLKLTRNTSWILGAGASYDCIGPGRECVPITRNLINVGRLDSDFVALLQSLERQVSTIGPSLTQDIDVALGTHMEHTIDWLRGLCASDTTAVSRDASRCLRELIRQIAHEITWSQHRALATYEGTMDLFYCAENYLLLASSCCYFPDWSIITLNYDCVLDRAFEELGIASRVEEFKSLGLPSSKQYKAWLDVLDAHFYGKAVTEPQSGVYLKLHGSVGLYSCLNPGCNRFRHPFNVRPLYYSGSKLASSTEHQLTDPSIESGTEEVFSSESLRGRRVENIGWSQSPRCPACGEETSELILPPGHNKTRPEGAYHDLMYHLAERTLGRANVWIIVGYSCPEYDEDVANLLKQATKHRPEYGNLGRSIYVVSPHAHTIAERLSQTLGHPIEPSIETFTSFCDKMMKAFGQERPGLA